MKKLVYILIFSPIIFFTSCSSGGGDNPSNVSLLPGLWMQVGLEGDYRYYTANGVTLLDTSIYWDEMDLIYNLGYIIGYAITEEGTYAAYSSDGITTLLEGTGTWSATSNTLSLDGTVYGNYTVNSNNLTINTNDVLGVDLGDGIFMDATNIKEFFADIDDFGIISSPQTKREAPDMKQLHLLNLSKRKN